MTTWQNLKQFNQNLLEYLEEKILVNKLEDGIISKYFFLKSPRFLTQAETDPETS